jgi:hypothetical protein
MKTIQQFTIALTATAALAPIATAQVTTHPIACESVAVQMKAVALPSPRSGALVNFTGSGGQLDPTPLLETTFTVPASTQRAVCVFVTFSAQIDPADNYGVYQASIDNVPMNGHGSLAAEYPGLTTPIVFDAVNQGTYLPIDPYRYLNGSNSRFVSYSFFATVAPGTHTMRIKMAACCSQAPGGFGGVSVRAATALVRW